MSGPEVQGYEQRSGRDRFFRLLDAEMAVLIDPDTGRMREDWAERVDCLLCGPDGEPHGWATKQGLEFERCAACGLVFMSPRPSRQGLEDLYRFESEANDAWVDVLLSDAEEAFQSSDFGSLLDLIQTVCPGGSLLDVGCSIGRLLSIARERGFSVRGLELGERAAAVARDRYGLDVRSVRLEDAGIEDASQDVVTLIETLEHLPDPRSMLAEIRRVLRPGGAFLVGVPNLGSLGVMILRERARTFNRNHLLYFDESTLGRLLREEGFEPRTATTAVTVLDSVLNHLQGEDPFGPRVTTGLPPRLASMLSSPGQRDRIERALIEAGLGYRLRMLAVRA